MKGNGIQVTEHQFPDIYQITANLTHQMGLKKMPEIYILQAGGMLNAFASCFWGRNYVVLYSDIVEPIYTEDDKSSISFIVCHELAHIKRGHTKLWKKLLILPGFFFPFLGAAYHRGCEYTCDRFGAALHPEKSVQALCILAAGKKLYKQVDAEQVILQSKKGKGFWAWIAEIFSSHPHLLNRIRTAAQVNN